MQGISTIFADQMTTCLVLRKVLFFAGIKEMFYSLPPSVTALKNDTVKFKAA
jgi:hypothetical protein